MAGLPATGWPLSAGRVAPLATRTAAGRRQTCPQAADSLDEASPSTGEATPRPACRSSPAAHVPPWLSRKHLNSRRARCPYATSKRRKLLTLCPERRGIRPGRPVEKTSPPPQGGGFLWFATSVPFGTVTDEVTNPAEDLPEQMRVRREKLDRLRSEGVDPYPVNFPRTATNGEIRAEIRRSRRTPRPATKWASPGASCCPRPGGKLCFATLRDGSGDLQVMISLDQVGEESLAAWKRDVDLGDHVGVEGEVITSRRGELSILADRWAITAKCLRPLPEKHAGLTDPEARVRQRYVDLIVNDEARKMACTAQRRRAGDPRLLARRGLPRGRDADAPADPRRCHGPAVQDPHQRLRHGALPAHRDRALPQAARGRRHREGLRDQPQLPQRGRGLHAQPRVHDARGLRGLPRLQRHGGPDPADDPERGRGRARAPPWSAYDGQEFDLGIARVAADHPLRGGLGGAGRGGHDRDAAGARSGSSPTSTRSTGTPKWGQGKLVQEIFEALVEHTLIQPTFVMDYPLETSPLTRQHRDDPLLTEKWDLIGFGTELGTAYSELVDPVEQRRRLTEQSLLAAGGDPEAMQLDEDFLQRAGVRDAAHGRHGARHRPPVMAFTGKNIRETILFPLVKPAQLRPWRAASAGTGSRRRRPRSARFSLYGGRSDRPAPDRARPRPGRTARSRPPAGPAARPGRSGCPGRRPGAGAGPRVQVERSGSANTSGSRLAAPSSAITASPAADRRPAQLHVLQRGPERELDGRVVAQDFLHRLPWAVRRRRLNRRRAP